MADTQRLVAVAGAGHWGKNLVRNFYELGVLRAVCDADPALLGAFGEKYPGVDLEEDYHRLLARPEVRAVAIATPAVTHYSLAKDALLAGKDVFVEKPLCMREDEADELISIAEEGGRVLMVGHLLQYHPAFLALKKLANDGELGRIYYIYSNRLNLGKIRREENILWSFAPHDISMILSLVGEMPEKVVARGGNYLSEKVADVTLSILEFSSGLKAHIFVSWLHPYKEQRLVVVGNSKMAVFNDVAPLEDGHRLLLYPHKISWEGQIPTPHKADATPVPVEEAEPLRRECQHFLDCVSGRTTPTTDGHEGRRVLKVLNACQRSINEQRPITLAAESSAPFFVHPTAVVDMDAARPVEIGEGTKIWHFSHVLPGTRIGRNCVLGQNVMAGPDVTIGNNVRIQNNVSIYKGVTLEDDVFCGPSMVFTNVINPRSHVSRKDEFRATLVRRGATIGANATIVCGHEVGAYSFVGAGSVVTRDVPDYALVVGSPARITGWMCVCGQKLTFDGEGKATCSACEKHYVMEGPESVRRCDHAATPRDWPIRENWCIVRVWWVECAEGMWIGGINTFGGCYLGRTG